MSTRRRTYGASGNGIEISEAPNGVYVLGSDNYLYTKETWNTNDNDSAAAIAVIRGSFKAGISLDEAKKYIDYDDSSIPSINLPIMGGSDGDTFDKELGKGPSNTDELISLFGSSTTTAAGYCKNYKFKNGKYGHLPVMMDWITVLFHTDEINEYLDLVEGTKITRNFIYWSSSYAGSYKFWEFLLTSSSSANPNPSPRFTVNTVRPFQYLT